ncbi:MAG: hypothetical protein GX087_06290 [Desulfobulbaceae bacterium]|nr:hypothetical protein [Desulfobulbaceae bacterium]
MLQISVTRLALLALALAVFGLSTGCSQKKYGAVKFDSSPAGAEVVNLKDDATFGLTPILVTWESSSGEPEYVTVQMRKAGYLEEITSFWLNTRHSSREAAQAEPQPINVILKARK